MFGCLGRLGCLVMLALLAAAGFFTKDLWYPRARALLVAEAPAASERWRPSTAEAGTNGTRIAARLGEKNGPVFADLSPAEFVAWMMVPAMKILGTSAGNPEASVHGDTLFVRSSVSITELGDATGASACRHAPTASRRARCRCPCRRPWGTCGSPRGTWCSTR
ncbi:MAG: hypothetical protein NTW72_07665 [Gemmatimonadetes bacterium]|nr:hypothetical protein [Gemmatimonadota bacterium]